MNKLLLLITGFLFTQLTYAQELIPCADGTYADPMIGCVSAPASTVSSESNIAELMLQFASPLLSIVMGAAVLFLIFGGIKYATAVGDEEKIQKSKRIILWSVVGLVIALLARTLAQFILDSLV